MEACSNLKRMFNFAVGPKRCLMRLVPKRGVLKLGAQPHQQPNFLVSVLYRASHLTLQIAGHWLDKSSSELARRKSF